MLGGFHSPRFESMGCIGAILWVILIVAAVLGLLWIPWSLILDR